MPTPLTRRGARSVTADFDRLANLIQSELAILDIPEKIAADFALRCDLLSDHIERVAIANEKAAKEPDALSVEEMAKKPVKEQVDDDPKSKDQNTRPNATSGDKMAAPEWAQPARNETGDSIEPGPANEGFDANAIGDEHSGPYKQEPDESYMSGEFTQQENKELREKQEAGQIPGVDKMAALRRELKNLTAKIEALAAEDADDDESDETKKAASDDRLLRRLLAEEGMDGDEEEKSDKEASNNHGYNLTE